jgi:sugar phosphate isomerase/epimerase
MLTRRSFLGSIAGGVAAGAAVGDRNLRAAGRLAWPGPIGLELYTVRDLFARDPAATLKQVAAVGYKEVENGFAVEANVLNPALRAAGLTMPSAYIDVPKSVEDWKKSVGTAKEYGVHYLVVGDNPRLDADAWKRRADLFNECGKVCLDAGIQFCYHAHFHELAPIDGTTGYDIMLTHCDPKLLKMEMDIFWVTYSGADPLHYWRLYPGRFPLLHVKDLYKNVTVNPRENPSGPNPFAPVGQGRIDWPKIFAHVEEAGVRHIYVEQDECNMPPLEAIKISFHYLKNLRLA